VEEYAVETWDGTRWNVVVSGTTIGHKRLDRFPDVTASKVRLTIRKSLACPTIRAFGLYRAE
jgi:alpha-L-fucosidase